jgi:Zn-dependent protease with chaperone function
MKHIVESTIGLFQSGSIGEVEGVLGAVDVSILMTHIAFGTTLADTLPGLLVRGAWLVYLTFCWLVFVLSAGSFFVQEFRGRRAAGGVATHTGDLGERLRERIRVLCGRGAASLLETSVILVESSMPFAKARYTGLFRREKAVEVSTRWLQLLNEEEIDALLAHELAHHSLGHARKDQLLRLLGRLTFFGDGFTRILQDSFNYEIEADRCAVLVFRVKPRALISCLYYMRNIAGAETLRHLISYEGVSIGPLDANETMSISQELASMRWTRRLKVAIHAYFQQYLGLKYSGYWHPSLERRIAMLEKLGKSEQFAK